MCELENSLIPKLADKICSWSRYVADTFGFIKPGEEKSIQQELNSYHQSIQFTYELEENNKIPFLDVLITKSSNGKLETSVYRKSTNTDVYMNWKSHAPSTWKIATLKSLIKRAFLVSSTNSSLNNELSHLKKVFCNYNDYPLPLVDEIIKNERNQNNTQQQKDEQKQKDPNPTEEDKITLTLNLPYAGDKGEKVITKLQKYIKNTVNKEKKKKKISVNTVYKSMKLSSRFNIKDKTKYEHTHNVVYHAKCPNKKCTSHYGGQTKCRIGKRTSQHRSTDKNSHILKHTKETKHKQVNICDFKILGKGYKSDFKRRISESLFIKKLKPDLNVQKDSYKLSLFN